MKQKLSPQEKKLRRKKIENIITVIYLFIRFFFFEHFMIPSSSMTPTLRTGDLVFIKKYTFSWSRNSILLGGYLPFWKEGIKLGRAQRGQMAVFTLERDPKVYYVKRIVAIGGDRVQVKDGVLHINGQPSKMELIEETEFLNDYGKMEKVKKYKVTLPIAPFKEYYIIRNKEIGEGSHDNTPEYTVPEGKVWLQGDFNTGSADSFSTYMKGAVPENRLVGTPFFILWNTNSRLPTENNWAIWIMQLPWRILYAFKETNTKRYCVFVD